MQRHIGLVHSVALRHTANAQHAQDITQAVFVILARKAGSLGSKTVLPGWLYHTARLTAANFQRAETRRVRREQEAFMQSKLEESTTDALWRELSPQLDEAMAGLGASERDALVLRYFQNKSMAEVGKFLGLEENTAQKRVNRALEKLRKFFAKRGVDSTTATIAENISIHSVQAVPVTLAKSVTAVALAKGATASISTLTLIKGALKVMAWTKAKTTVIAGIVVLLAAGTTTMVTTALIKKSSNSSAATIYEQIWAHPNSDSIPALEKAPPALIIRPTRYPNRGGGLWADDGKGFWVNCSVAQLIGMAYDWSSVRTVFPDSLPGGNYDVMESLPNGQNAAAYQEEIKKQFGLVAHKETLETNVLLLKVSNPVKLQSHLSRGGNTSAFVTGYNNMQTYKFINESLSVLPGSLEFWFDAPIIDQSGLSNRYDFQFQWANNITATKRHAAILRDQLDQLGLELVPSREPVEMLVVEKAK